MLQIDVVYHYNSCFIYRSPQDEKRTEKQILDSTESLIKESAIFISKTSLTEKIDTTEIFITNLTINNHKKLKSMDMKLTNRLPLQFRRFVKLR